MRSCIRTRRTRSRWSWSGSDEDGGAGAGTPCRATRSPLRISTPPAASVTVLQRTGRPDEALEHFAAAYLEAPDELDGRAHLVEALARTPEPRVTLSDNAPARRIIASPDFYALSGCRDLFFPTHEDRFSPPRISRALERLRLHFLGFEFPDHRVRQLYRQRFPQDPAPAVWQTGTASTPSFPACSPPCTSSGAAPATDVARSRGRVSRGAVGAGALLAGNG